MSSSAAATCWIDQCYVERHRMWSHLIGSWFSCRKQFDQSENAMTTEGNFERFLEISSFESIAIKCLPKAPKYFKVCFSNCEWFLNKNFVKSIFSWNLQNQFFGENMRLFRNELLVLNGLETWCTLVLEKNYSSNWVL